MKAKITHRWAVLAGLASPLLLGSAAAWSADQAETAKESGGLEEVFVTAQFRKENLQQTPIAITAVNAEMLEQRSQTSVADIAAQAPNVTLKPAGTSTGPAMVAYIRGIGQTDFNYALEPGVGIYVDDVYISTLTGSLLDLLDLDRVEVLRGPQGTLSGKNSIGGSIKLFSKRPDGDGGGFIQATYGGLQRTDFRGTADFTMIPDTLFARISGSTHHRNGYVTRLDYGCSHPGSGVPVYTNTPDCVLGTEGGQDSNSARLMLRWVATDAVEVNVSADVTNDHSEPPANVPLYEGGVANGTLTPNPPWLSLNGVPLDNRFVPYGPYAADPLVHNGFVTYETFMDPRPTAGADFSLTHPFDPANPYSPTSVRPVNSLSGWGTSGTIDWTIQPGTTLKSITAYRRYDSDFSDDSDGTPVADQLLMQHLTHHQFSQELRLSGDLFGNALDYTVGGFYFSQGGFESANVDLAYVPNFIGSLNFIHGPDDTTAHTKAGFLHLTWHATDKLSALAGLRYSEEDKKYTYHRRNPDLTLPDPCPAAPPFTAIYPANCAVAGYYGFSSKFEGSRTDYRAALNYQWTPNVMTYLQFSTGYKGGGVNPRPFVPDQIKTFNPETLDAYEFGFKSQLFGALRLNGAVFYNDYKDIQLGLTFCPDSVSPAPCIEPHNVGQAHVKGAELEWELHHGGLEFDGSASYLDFEYTKLTGQTGVTLDMVTPFTPKWKYSAGVQYSIPVAGGSITPRLDYSYQSKIYTAPANTNLLNAIDAYGLLNGRLTWRSGDDLWQVALEGTNLTNKYYFVTIFSVADTGAGFVSGQPGVPREWAITIKRNFR